MGPWSYMWSIVDRNIVMWRMTVHVFWIFMLYLWPDQFEFMAVFRSLNCGVFQALVFVFLLF